ncbi:diaminopimelate epimerase [Sulfuricurvum kujiense DSM 16994]|uniref:Diaminopimelate epimerase n=1 Tax=Sulfuricurvum kujiense (strain ATCC BAA-921 / DSM 16994 / JCM 11577 / YK-1) TaxID=709032 RepID=E4TWT9_SULKY|nr:diaminopimelate epimerase [Sulfuricurvum kujiense]ADR32770.1 diaminopimelate epimerase [Sulfuricurvum kujiense DSM 16994]
MLQIAKYCASGNDFVIFHAFEKADRSQLARILCDRQNGIGADGLIVLVPHESHDFEWEFYNADGSTASMCGNGSRACAHYAHRFGLAPSSMAFLTGAGVIKAHVEGDMVQSDLTPPVIVNQEIVESGMKWWLIDTGVPHLITFDADIEHFNIDLARTLRHRYNANVNIASINLDGTLRVRTYERGVEDETLACGTGMAASFYRAVQERLVDENTKVFPKSGETLYLGFEEGVITFKGEVKGVFETTWRN